MLYVYYGHLGTTHKCPVYRGVLIFQDSLYDKAPFGTITKRVIMQVSYILFSSVLINMQVSLYSCTVTTVQLYSYSVVIASYVLEKSARLIVLTPLNS